MRVDDARRYVFIHVPRTGGHSFYKLMGRTHAPLHTRYWNVRHKCSGYYAFGMMRNPWDRLYSCYRKQRLILDVHKNSSFKHYLLEGIHGDQVERPAMWFLKGCDYVGRFESFQESWNHIFAALDMPPANMPHVNAVDGDDYRLHYDNEMIEHIEWLHLQDIIKGGYTFE